MDEPKILENDDSKNKSLDLCPYDYEDRQLHS